MLSYIRKKSKDMSQMIFTRIIRRNSIENSQRRLEEVGSSEKRPMLFVAFRKRGMERKREVEGERQGGQEGSKGVLTLKD
jgi:hypothetical protein